MQGTVQGLYWLPVPAAMRTPLQEEHSKQCGPHVLALEVEGNAVILEFLVRAQNALHCNCVGYADASLRQHMMLYVDELLLSLNITV